MSPGFRHSTAGCGLPGSTGGLKPPPGRVTHWTTVAIAKAEQAVLPLVMGCDLLSDEKSQICDLPAEAKPSVPVAWYTMTNMTANH
jgi:hypothetical protein